MSHKSREELFRIDLTTFEQLVTIRNLGDMTGIVKGHHEQASESHERLNRFKEHLISEYSGDNGESDTSLSFADEQLLVFGRWVFDLLGFDVDEDVDRIDEAVKRARKVIVPLLARSGNEKEEKKAEVGKEVDVFEDETTFFDSGN